MVYVRHIIILLCTQNGFQKAVDDQLWLYTRSVPTTSLVFVSKSQLNRDMRYVLMLAMVH
jgi:hypothetical protein